MNIIATRLPTTDQGLRAWVNQFHSACAGNLTVLGITSPQVTALNDAFLEFDTTLTDLVAKKAATKATVGAKDTARAEMLAKLRPLIHIIRGHDVPVAILDDLGIGPIDPPAPVPPEEPIDLMVRTYTNGTNWLTWKRGSNRRGATYVVEVNNADTSGWQIVASVTSTSFRHKLQVPGFEQWYRVTAMRKGEPGIPSPMAIAYGTPPESSAQVVELKAA